MPVSFDRDRIAQKAAEARPPAAHEIAGTLDGFEPAHQPADADLRLHPRQRIAAMIPKPF